MGKPQTITTDAGEELVVLPRRDYVALLARAGDEEAENEMTALIASESQAALSRGEDVMLPHDVVKEIAGGTPVLKALRLWRGLTQDALARQAELSQVVVSQIENGRRVGSIATMKRLAAALAVPVAMLIEDRD